MKHLTYAAIAALALGAQAVPLSAEVLKISTFVPPNHAFNRMLTAWGEELAEKSGGELTVEIFPAGQLGPPPRQFDLVRSGAADVTVVLHGATPGRFPMSELAGMPQVAPSAGTESAITSRRLTELAPEFLAEEHEGTRILWMAVTPPLKIHMKGEVPADLSALEGTRIRYAGVAWQQIIEALGASPVPVPPAQSADALSKGVVDGASFPYEAALSFDLAPVTDYSIEPGLSPATFSVVIGDAAYARLTPEMRALVDETTGPDRGEAFGMLWDEGEAHGRDYMVEAGNGFLTLSADQQAELRDKLSGIVTGAVAALDAEGKPASAFIEAYTR